MTVPTDPQELRAHAAFLRGLARRLIADESRVDDVVQETWLAALERPPRQAGSLRSWLGSVALNFARRGLRGDARRARRQREAARPEAQLGADARLRRDETLRSVVEAVLSLNEPYRTAVLMHYYEDLGADAIADRLGVPLETVRTRLKRAIEKLREKLDAEHGGRKEAWRLPFAALFGSEPPHPRASSVPTGGFEGVATKIALVALLAVAGFFVVRPMLSHREDGAALGSNSGTASSIARSPAGADGAASETQGAGERTAGAPETAGSILPPRGSTGTVRARVT